MAIEIVSDANGKKPKLICPHCQQIMIVNLVGYEQDATKPILTNCPYCGGGIFSCVILLASKDLKQLQGMINQAVGAVSSSVSRNKLIIDGTKMRTN